MREFENSGHMVGHPYVFFGVATLPKTNMSTLEKKAVGSEEIPFLLKWPLFRDMLVFGGVSQEICMKSLDLEDWTPSCFFGKMLSEYIFSH